MWKFLFTNSWLESWLWIAPHFFFKDIADGLVGVGLITQSEDCPGVLTLDKGYNDMSKFLNRILGLKVFLITNLTSDSATQ